MASPSPRTSDASQKPKKGERSRARLKDAARQVLAARGYRAARVTDITQGAGLSQVATRIEHHCGSPGVDKQTRLLGRRDPHQETVVRSPEHLAEALSVLWFRAVYACNPDPDRLTCTQDILRLQLSPAG